MIEKLSMTANCLTSVPTELGDMITLKELDLSDNRISEIAASFEQLKNLEAFKINNNRLTVSLFVPHKETVKQL